jgi:hypothetical protein
LQRYKVPSVIDDATKSKIQNRVCVVIEFWKNIGEITAEGSSVNYLDEIEIIGTQNKTLNLEKLTKLGLEKISALSRSIKHDILLITLRDLRGVIYSLFFFLITKINILTDFRKSATVKLTRTGRQLAQPTQQPARTLTRRDVATQQTLRHGSDVDRRGTCSFVGAQDLLFSVKFDRA